MAKVTPWEVEGKIDYDKIVKTFGLSFIDSEILDRIKRIARGKGRGLHLFLRRGLFFAHRDFDKTLDKYEAGEDFFLYTGRAPGGSMHIAHLIPFRFVKYLQDIFDVNLYIQIPDDEKFWFKKEITQERINEMVESDLLDIAAIGFNPDKTFVFRNSEYIRNMYGILMKVAKKISFAKAKAVFGFNNLSNIGMIFYPALQITPTFFEDGVCVIPCGIDQDPYFRLQRDFAEQLGFKKNVNIHSKFLPSLTGPEGKMSASDSEKAILLTDSPDTVRKKVMKYAFSGGQPTVDEHRKYGGNTEIDVSYQWLYYLFEDDDEEIKRIKKDYESGALLSSELKKILIDKINSFLDEHRKRKEIALKEKLLGKYMYTGQLAKKMWERFY